MKVKQTLFALLLMIGIGGIIYNPINPTVSALTCGGVETSLISCPGTKEEKDITKSGLWGILLLAINILTAGIGIMAVGGVVYGSILYTSAGNSPDQTKKAIGIITNVVIGLVAYALGYSFLNFLIPGGVFN